MSQEKDTGIVLLKKSTGEADYICSIYTKGSGKDRFIFRGLRKSTRRPRTGSEPGSIIELIYYTGKSGGYNTVSEFNILASNNPIRSSSDRILSLYFILELVDLTTGYSDPNTGIFNLLTAGIETLSNSDNPVHFTIFFTVKYLLLQGIFPDTMKCHWCGNDDPGKLFIENQNLRISCADCNDMHSALIKGRGMEFINKCVKLKLDKIDTAAYPEKDITPVLSVLMEYINNYYGIKLKTGTMLAKPALS